MQFLDVACGQGPLSLDEVKDTCDGRFMIGNDCHNLVRIHIVPVRNQRRPNPVFDEQLSDPAIQGVEAFDQSGLDGPLALQPLLELAIGVHIAQPLALLAPDVRQGAEPRRGQRCV